MAVSHEEIGAFTLIRTKLQRPWLPGDLVRRARLTEQMQGALHRKLILISAMAGAGKTTLLARWLEECPQPSAWLSLDEGDNDRMVFLAYLCGAIRTVFPSACDKALSLLHAPHTPSARAITTLIVNELERLSATPSKPDPVAQDARSTLPSTEGGRSDDGTRFTAPSQEGGRSEKGLILALDDYHHITDPAVHEIVSGLIERLPRGVHLALATRTDPPFPLAGWRARRELAEIRADDLRFTSEEAHVFLERAIGRELDPATVRLVGGKTEGWVVGLRLAALSMRTRSDVKAFVQAFQGTGSNLIVEYLLSEVLARQSPEIQDFLLRTSVLDRFCAPLCETVAYRGSAPVPGSSFGTATLATVASAAPAAPATEDSAVRSKEIIEWLARANLFLVSLDKEGRWYRYHHLFRDLLRHQLRLRTSAGDRSGLHARAGTWLAQNGLIDEALHHLLAAGDTATAVALVSRHRYALMNRAQWPRLERYLQQFSPELVDQNPDLLMTKTWLLYQRGRYAELPAAVQRIEATLARTTLAPEMIDPLQGEISALRSYVSTLALDVKGAVFHARHALAQTPHELWIVRLMARMCLAGALLMMSDVNGAYEAVYAGFEEEGDQSNAFKATLLTTACNIHWMTADLPGLARAAEQILMLSREPYSPAFRAWGHYHLGRVRYHHGDLVAAEEHFAAVVQEPYLSYGICYVNSACGLALTHQALGRPEQAREVAETAVAFMLETGNTTLLLVALAFQVELALMQGKIAAAGQQAGRFDPIPPLSPIYGLFSPHLTLVKVWLAQNTLAGRQKAAGLVGRVQAFCESTHNTRFLIEALALQALLHDVEDDEPAALVALEQAVTLAEPGRFIRLFADLGPPLDRLLDRLRRQGVAVEYITQILMAFETTDNGRTTKDERRKTDPATSSFVLGPSSLLAEPLTPRELEVLELLGRHLTNKEIAEELVVSPSTVKTHTLNIYRKLEVNSRKQAVARARALNIL